MNLKDVAMDSNATWKLVKSWLGWGSGGPPTQLHVNGAIIQKPYYLAQTMNNFFIDKVNGICARLPHSDYNPLKVF